MFDLVFAGLDDNHYANIVHICLKYVDLVLIVNDFQEVQP